MKKHIKKALKFLREDDSNWSLLANIILAFLIIYFVVYPVLGAVLGTSFPVVAVISQSMQHHPFSQEICGNEQHEWQHSFDNWWQVCGAWYQENQITKEQFEKFNFKNGFDKGDVILLKKATNVKVGDILVFDGGLSQPIIHRVVKVFEENGETFYQTKGDWNARSSTGIGETRISQDRVLGKGLVRIPYLGWVKILVVDAFKPLSVLTQR